HVRRSLAGIGNILMEIRRNTVSEIDPDGGGGRSASGIDGGEGSFSLGTLGNIALFFRKVR
ncbi:hypothetical protein, partial [Rhodococcus sp. 24CO]|uniref:hypothetical protein n=1 Tax=Rhodococcus sp. 24CO TaxID=3117460 RepID=UPI003D33B31C